MAANTFPNASKNCHSLGGRLILITTLFRGVLSGLVSGLASAAVAGRELENGLVRLAVRLAQRIVVGRRDGLLGRRRVGGVLGVVLEDVANSAAGTRLQLCGIVCWCK